MDFLLSTISLLLIGVSCFSGSPEYGTLSIAFVGICTFVDDAKSMKIHGRCITYQKKITQMYQLSNPPSFFPCKDKKVVMGSVHEKVPASPLRVPPSPSRFSMSPKLDRVGSVHLNMNEVKRATHNFSEALKIGEGGFGTVLVNLPPEFCSLSISLESDADIEKFVPFTDRVHKDEENSLKV